MKGSGRLVSEFLEVKGRVKTDVSYLIKLGDGEGRIKRSKRTTGSGRSSCMIGLLNSSVVHVTVEF